MAERERLRGDRLLEVIAVLLLGAATLGSAWCAFQSSRWNDVEAEVSHEASRARQEGARVFGLATQTVVYDAVALAQYAEAVAGGNDDVAAFLRRAVIRPGFLDVLDRWEAEVEAGTFEGNLVTDQAYLDEQLAPYRELEAEAAEYEARREEAADNAEQFVLTTLFMASALFFAGVTSSFRTRSVRILLLGAAGVTLAFAAARLVDLPVA